MWILNMISNEVIHRSKRKDARLQPVFEKQFLEERPEIVCYAASEIDRISPGFRIGENIPHDELVKT